MDLYEKEDNRWTHPALREQQPGAEGEEVGGDQPEAPESDQPVAEATPDAPESPGAAEQAELDGYRFDRTNLYKDLRAAFDADPHFRNVVKTLTGREEAVKSRSETARLQAELDNLRLEKARSMIETMPAEEVEQRYNSDPEFAQLVDWSADAQPADPNAIAESEKWNAAIERVFQSGLNRGLPPEAIQYYEDRLLAPGACTCSVINRPHAPLDHTPDGREVSELEALDLLREVIDSDLRQMEQQKQSSQQQPSAVEQAAPTPAAPVAAAVGDAVTGTAPQAQQQPAPQRSNPQQLAAEVSDLVTGRSNPRLAQATPDMSTGDPVGASRQYTSEEVRAMTPQEIMQRWGEPGAFNAAFDRGEIQLSQ